MIALDFRRNKLDGPEYEEAIGAWTLRGEFRRIARPGLIDGSLRTSGTVSSPRIHLPSNPESGTRTRSVRLGRATAFFGAACAGSILAVLVSIGVSPRECSASRASGPARCAPPSRSICPGRAAGYTLLSLSRGLAAYVLSLAFSLWYGYWAAKGPHRGAAC
jgi:hypothetical protein